MLWPLQGHACAVVYPIESLQPMENTDQPKKRGRKRKTEITTETSLITKPETAPVIQAKVVTKTPVNSYRNERKRIVGELERKAKELDPLVNDSQIISRVHDRMASRRLLRMGHIEQNYMAENRNLENLENLKFKDLSQNSKWQFIVLPGAMRKLCSAIDFLLKNGPMTKIEGDIFNECISLVKSYYSERSGLISDENISEEAKRICRRTTFYPDRKTPIYDFVSEILSVLDLGELGKYFQEKVR